MDRRRFLLAAACLAAAPARAEDWPTAPQDIVRKVYSFYVGKNAKGAYGNKQVRARYFSASLDALVNKAEATSRKKNEAIIDFDPIINGQDYETPKDLAVSVVTPGSDKTTLRARFKQFGTQQQVDFDFVQENGAWKIFDLRGGAGQDAWSLRKIASEG